MNHITYRKLRGYKYQLLKEYSCQVPLNKEASNSFILLEADGTITMRKNYAWDGASGPTFDTKNFMRPSLVHDALYQLMREGKLNRKEDRKIADETLRNMCIEDGMSRFRAAYVYLAVHWFGYFFSKPYKEEIQGEFIAP